MLMLLKDGLMCQVRDQNTPEVQVELYKARASSDKPKVTRKVEFLLYGGRRADRSHAVKPGEQGAGLKAGEEGRQKWNTKGNRAGSRAKC